MFRNYICIGVPTACITLFICLYNCLSRICDVKNVNPAWITYHRRRNEWIDVDKYYPNKSSQVPVCWCRTENYLFILRKHSITDIHHIYYKISANRQNRMRVWRLSLHSLAYIAFYDSACSENFPLFVLFDKLKNWNSKKHYSFVILFFIN